MNIKVAAFRISEKLNNTVFVSAGQKLIIDMWREKAASPLHILHGGFGVGSFIIPLIANPFLAVTVDNPNNGTLVNTTVGALEGIITQSHTTPLISTTEASDEFLKPSRIEWAYAIAAAITASLSLVFYGYQFLGAKSNTVVSNKTHNEKEVTAESDQQNSSMSFKNMFNPATCAGGQFVYGLQIFALLIIYFFNCVGGERVGGKFVRAFAIDYHGFSKDDGSYINTCFWISFAVGRFLGFLTARWIPIRILILLETGGALATSICLVIFGGSSSTALWVLMQPAGFFVAPLFPTGIGWANFHIQMTGVGITVILLGGSLGGIAYMKLIGYLYDTYGPKTFLYTLLGYSIAVFVLAILLDLVQRKPEKPVKTREMNEIDVMGTAMDNKDSLDKKF